MAAKIPAFLFGKELLPLTAQVDILQNLETGSADIGIMDSVMAGHYLTHGSYVGKIASLDLFTFPAEEYGIGAKKGNDALVGKVNEALIALAANGTFATIASEYGLQNEVLVAADTRQPQGGRDRRQLGQGRRGRQTRHRLHRVRAHRLYGKQHAHRL